MDEMPSLNGLQKYTCRITTWPWLGLKGQEPASWIVKKKRRTVSISKFIKEHKALAAGWIAAVSLILLSGLIFVFFYLKNQPKEQARDISSELMAIETGDLTYSDIYDEVLILAKDEEMREKLDRLFDPLYMSDKVNVLCIEDMADVLGVSKQVYSSIISGRDELSTISRDEFDRIYQNILETGEISGVERITVYIDSIRNENKKIVINDGYDDHSCSLKRVDEELKGKIIEAYAKDGDIFKITGPSDGSFTLRNVWVYETEAESCKFLFGGDERIMKVKAGTKLDAGRFCDIVFTNEGITGQVFCPSSVRGRVLAINSSRIRLKGKAWLSLDEDMQVYDISGGTPVSPKTVNRIIGYKEVRLVLSSDDKVQGIIIEAPEIANEEIRVLLNEHGYEDYVMDSVTIQPEEPIYMQVGESKDEILPSVLEPGIEFTFRKEEYPVGTVITLWAENPEGKVKISSLERGYGAPSYRGYIELTREEEGFYVVNGLSIEEYLYGVISSELPNSFDIEAQKALAVCARGYAYNHIEDGTFAEYGANVDDTIMCQAYNNYPETETSIDAVDETYGVVMTHDGFVIMAYYFSTSAGVTCNNAEIWEEEPEAYLTDNIETPDKPIANLSNEDSFINFMNTDYPDMIEKDMPFYRWNIEFTAKEMTETINRNLPERVERSTDWIQVMTGPDTFEYDENLKSIGDVENVEVIKRSRGGVVQEMLITGSEATIKVEGYTNVVGLITPEKVAIVTATGTKQEGWNMIPSPTYYVEKTAKGFTIHGGGFGHGCGLSQYGADLLAKAGNDYRYILLHYYKDVKFDNIYSQVLESDLDTASATDADKDKASVEEGETDKATDKEIDEKNSEDTTEQ